MGGRRKAREAALQVLYNLDITGSGGCGTEDAMRARIVDTKDAFDPGGYGEELVEGVAGNMAAIDGLIERSSENWTIERMPVVDRNILRIAVFELCFAGDVPYKAVIDEAVELAKRYGSDESGPFVNGILDKVRKEKYPDKD